MYRQSIHNIKVAILPLDGIILDLNRYRYNYYHHLCDQKKISIPKDKFYLHLSNMYDMYKDLPLSHTMDVGPFNARVERELFQYLSHKGILPKNGCTELIEYFHQKEIPVAVISTHRTKDAVAYLKLIQLYHRVHFIIGSDAISHPLPSTQILETVAQHFDVSYEQVLVISPFLSLNRAAFQLHMNIIYCDDLISAQEEEIQTSYKCVKDVFEVLNTVIFDRYEDADLYSSILGMTASMNKSELDYAKRKLEDVYQDDEQIIDLVHKTYAYHISMLNEQNVKDGSVLLSHKNTHQRFYFDDEVEAENTNLVEENKEDIVKEENIEQEKIDTQHVLTLPPEEEDDLTSLLRQINKREQQSSTPKITDYNEIENIVINAQDSEEEKENKDESPLLSFITNCTYIAAISFLITFGGLTVYVAFIHQFDNKTGIFRIIALFFNLYYGMIERILRFIFNSLHAMIQLIPSYNHYMHQNIWFSSEGMMLFNIFIFQIVIISLIKIVIYIIRRLKDEESDS